MIAAEGDGADSWAGDSVLRLLPRPRGLRRMRVASLESFPRPLGESFAKGAGAVVAGPRRNSGESNCSIGREHEPGDNPPKVEVGQGQALGVREAAAPR